MVSLTIVESRVTVHLSRGKRHHTSILMICKSLCMEEISSLLIKEMSLLCMEEMFLLCMERHHDSIEKTSLYMEETSFCMEETPIYMEEMSSTLYSKQAL